MIKNEEQNIDDLFGASAIAIIITENMMVKLNDIKVVKFQYLILSY